MQEQFKLWCSLKEIPITDNEVLTNIPIDKIEAFMFADGGAMGRPGELKYYCKIDNSIVLYRGNRFTKGIDSSLVNQIFTKLNEAREWFHFSMGFGNHICMKPIYEKYFNEARETSEKHIYKAHEEILRYIISLSA